MFRGLRRKKQLLSESEAVEILNKCTSGVLAVAGDDHYPYAVPLSYAYQDGKLFFHCSKDGHKIDSLARNDKVSFCVIETDAVRPETFTTHYRSVIAFGRARIVTDDREKKTALQCLVKKYSADYIVEGEREIERDWNRVCVVAVDIEHLTGKAAIEIITSRKS